MTASAIDDLFWEFAASHDREAFFARVAETYGRGFCDTLKQELEAALARDEAEASFAWAEKRGHVRRK